MRGAIAIVIGYVILFLVDQPPSSGFLIPNNTHVSEITVIGIPTSKIGSLLLVSGIFLSAVHSAMTHRFVLLRSLGQQRIFALSYPICACMCAILMLVFNLPFATFSLVYFFALMFF